jgi:hypothetical protein
MEPKKTISVKFNSNYKLATETKNNINYYVDWSAILKDNIPYLLTYNYTGQRNVFTNATKIASLYINIYGENYIASGRGANPTNLLCPLDYLSVPGNSGNLFVVSNIKNQIFLHSRPQNNNVNIQILNNDVNPTIWTEVVDTTAQVNNYILTLTFTEL